MRTNPVKTNLLAGTPCIGTMAFEFNTTGMARLAAASDADFILFDMEHTGWSLETIRTLLATSQGPQIVPMVRVPASDYHFIARVLDMGAMGIMVPMVESVQQARDIVRHAKYPPTGRRGGAFGISHDNYEGGGVTDKIETANANTLLIAQIETVHGLEAVDDIAAVDGIDVLWVGQTDLSLSLGIPGQFDAPEFTSALDRVIQAAHANNKAAGYMAMSVEECYLRHQQGVDCLAYSGDLWLYQQALGEGIRSVRAHYRS